MLGLPIKVLFRSWRLQLRAAAASAHPDSDAAFAWIRFVGNPKRSFEYFAVALVSRFRKLDALLGAGLLTVASGDLGREIALRAQGEAKAGRLIKGRRRLWIIYDYYHSRGNAGSLYDFANRLSIQLTHESNLRSFMRNWDNTVIGLRKEPNPAILETLFIRQIRKCHCSRTCPCKI